MQPLHDQPPVDEALIPVVTHVHVVKTAIQETPAMGRPEPLHIEYTDTAVLPEARQHLLQVLGVTRGDSSALGETFKLLRTQILQRMRLDGHRLIGITSPRRTVGKSLTAANLALSMAADLDTAVLLIDADLSGYGVQSLFGLHQRPGLIEHLTQGHSLSDLLVNPGIERLVLLPAGLGPIRNSAELLSSKTLQHLLQEMRQRYHDRVIVVDLPPLLDSADALAFLPQVDTTLVVVEDNTSAIRDLKRATDMLAPFELMGSVLSPSSAPPPRRPWYRFWRR
jgi:Mrp family chromosome partitioning ATPase